MEQKFDSNRKIHIIKIAPISPVFDTPFIFLVKLFFDRTVYNTARSKGVMELRKIAAMTLSKLLESFKLCHSWLQSSNTKKGRQ